MILDHLFFYGLGDLDRDRAGCFPLTLREGDLLGDRIREGPGLDGDLLREGDLLLEDLRRGEGVNLRLKGEMEGGDCPYIL